MLNYEQEVRRMELQISELVRLVALLNKRVNQLELERPTPAMVMFRSLRDGSPLNI